MTDFCHVIGARPNFIKAFPLLNEMSKQGLRSVVVHTGQHNDYEMSGVFFDKLPLPKPDYHLGVSGGTLSEQTSRILAECEKTFRQLSPKFVVVYGDVNSTLAASLAAAQMRIPLVHVEAGCRSFDKSMPEEMNRVIVDHLSDYLFCIDNVDFVHLAKENITKNVWAHGNLMADAVLFAAKQPNELSKREEKYAVLTLHRPFNVDNVANLTQVLDVVNSLKIPVYYPVHPRAKKAVESVIKRYDNLKAIEPMGYVEFVHLVMGSVFVMTDSGGIQTETSVLGTPCFTLRPNTEHGSSIVLGTNTLCPNIEDLPRIVEGGHRKKAEIAVQAWDGMTASRIASTLGALLEEKKACDLL